MSTIEDSGYPILVPKNDHEDATLLSISAAPVTDFPAEDTQNTIRDRVWRNADASAVDMTWVLPETRTADSFFLIRHTAAGGNIEVEFFSDAGASSSVFTTGSLPATWYTDNDPYTFSTGTNDPLAHTYPYRTYFDAIDYRSYKISFSGTPSFFSYWQVSTIFLGKAFQFAQSAGYGLPMGVQDIVDKNRSMGASLRTNVSETWQTAVIDFLRIMDFERGTVTKFKRLLGTGRAFMFSLYPGDGDDRERDNMGMWKFAALDPLVRDVALYTQRLQLEEC